MPRPLPLLLLMLPAFLAGCSSYAPPRLSVGRAFVSEESERGMVVTFVVDALNTNSEELPLHEVRYAVWLEGQRVFEGVRSPEATLRRLGTQPFSIPAVVRLEPGAPRPAGAARYAVEGRLIYSTPGTIAKLLFDLRLHRPSVAFREEGTVDLAPANPGSAAGDAAPAGRTAGR